MPNREGFVPGIEGTSSLGRSQATNPANQAYLTFCLSHRSPFGLGSETGAGSPI